MSLDFYVALQGGRHRSGLGQPGADEPGPQGAKGRRLRTAENTTERQQETRVSGLAHKNRKNLINPKIL